MSELFALKGQFNGGLILEEHKAESNSKPIRKIELPKRIVLPLRQHIGAPAQPLVKVGDKVKKGDLISRAAALVSAHIHAPTSGTVIDISDQPFAHPSGLKAPAIVIEPDGDDKWCERPRPLDDFHLWPAELLRERVRWAGVVGMGGATFPTNVKIRPDMRAKIDTLILNGAECEPYITCDDRLMRERADRIMLGLEILNHLVDPYKAILIGIEDNKPEAIAAMREALAKTELKNAEIAVIPSRYPSGGEKQLIKLLTGKEVPSQGIPHQIGVLVHNVATAATIADAVLDGRPMVSRVVTVTGEGVKEPQNLEVPIGTPVSHLIEQAGGYTEKAARLILGGPMMGFAVQNDAVAISKGSNCVLVTSEDESPQYPAKACIRCGRCAASCPADLLPQELYRHARARDFDKAQDVHLFDCIECGCCAYVCPSHIPLVQYFRFAKNATWASESEKRKAEQARQRHEARIARLDRLAAERKAKMRKKKDEVDAKKKSGDKKDAIAAARARSKAKKTVTSEATSETAE